MNELGDDKSKKQADVDRVIAEKYMLAEQRFAEGGFGETLHLLSEISKLKPRFDDRENLRSRAAEALDNQHRDRVFAETRRQAEQALGQHRWDDVAGIVSGLHERLGAENLVLADDQRAEVNRWTVDSVRRGRPERQKRKKQTLAPPASAVGATHSAGQPVSARPIGNLRKTLRANQVQLIVGSVLACFVLILSIATFQGASAPSDSAGFAEGATSDAETVPVEDVSAEPEEAVPPVEFEGIDRLRTIWADERESIIEDLNSISAVRVDQNGVLTGPPGISVDLSACPTDWNDSGGIEDGVIHLAHTTAQSGNLGAYGQFGRGMSAYFDGVNERGGIGPDGLLIDLTIYDDQYDATQTEVIVDELLANETAFAITTLGTLNTFAVRDAMNDACVPQPTVLSSHPAWSDPENYPWTTGLSMSYAAEAWLWGSWIEQEFTSPVTVGALVMDNDLGRSYETSFAQFAESSSTISSVEFVRHDPTAPSVTEEVAELATLEPTVFISMTAANPCLLAINAAAETGLNESAEALITPSICTQIESYVSPAGSAAEGWIAFGGGVDNPAFPSSRPGIYAEYVVMSLEEAGLDPNDTAAAEGFGLRAWVLHQILEVAANLPGGLTRSNMLAAQWGLREMTNPMMINGVRFGTYGTLSSGFIEGSEVSRFDAEAQVWKVEGVIDRSGVIPPCRWVSGLGCN